MDQPTSTSQLERAVTSRAAAFADQLRQVADGATRVPSLTWTVADLGQHVASLPSYWTGHHNAGQHFDRPDFFGELGDVARAHITLTDPSALANLVEAEFAAYAQMLAAAEEPLWDYGVPVSADNMRGLSIQELYVHGLDLAALTGATVPKLEAVEAHAAVAASMAITSVLVDPKKVEAQPDGVYHVRFKGGQDYTWTKTGDTLTVTEGKPPKADAHLVADPTTFVLSSLGRIGQIRASLGGKMYTYGRKPWRFLGLGKTLEDGI